MFANADIQSGLSDQTSNWAVLIHSQKFAPGGFCSSVEYRLSNVPSVTKSYLLLWVVRPCTKVWSAIWSLRQALLPPRLSIDRPTSASMISSCDGQLPPFAFIAFSTAALYDAMAK